MAALFAQPGQPNSSSAPHNGGNGVNGSQVQRTATSIHQAYNAAASNGVQASGTPTTFSLPTNYPSAPNGGGYADASDHASTSGSGNSTRPSYPSVMVPPPTGHQQQPDSPISSYQSAIAPGIPPNLIPGPPPTEQMRLFNAYIYEYLYRQGFTEAARAFLVHAPETSVKRVVPQQSGITWTASTVRPNASKKGKERAASPETTSPATGLTSAQNSRSHGLNGAPRAAASEEQEQLRNPDARVSHGNANSPPGSHMGRIVEDMEEEQDGGIMQIEDGFQEDGSGRNTGNNTRDQLGTAGSDASVSSHSTTASSSRFASIGSKSSATTAGTSLSSVGSTTAATRASSTTANRKDSGIDLDGSNASDPPTSARTPPTSNTSGLFSSPTSTPHANLPSQSTKQHPQRQSDEEVQLNKSSNSPLPEPDVQITAPQGFLYEWWAVFWDVFRARGEKGGSAASKAFLQAAVAPPTYYGQPIVNGQIVQFPSAAVGNQQQQQAAFGNATTATQQRQMAATQQQPPPQAVRASLPPQSATSQTSAGRTPSQQPTGPITAPTPQGSQEQQQQQQQSQARLSQQHQRQPTIEIDSPAAQHRLVSQQPTPGQQIQSDPEGQVQPSNGMYQVPQPGQPVQLVQEQQPSNQQQPLAQQQPPQGMLVQGPQGLQIQTGGPGTVVGQPQQMRQQMPGGPAQQRRYAVSGGPPGFPGQPQQPGQAPIVYRTAQGQIITAQPAGVGPHMRIVSGPGGPAMQTHPGLAAQQHQQQQQHLAYAGQPPPIPAGPGQGLQHQPQPAYLQQQQQQQPGAARPLVPQQQHQQAMYAQQQQQQRAGMMPPQQQPQQQAMMHQGGPPGIQREQQQQLGLRARPPSVLNQPQQQQLENASSPITMPMRAPSRSAAVSPFPQHALPPGTPASNGPTPTPAQQQFARPGQPQQQQSVQQIFGPIDHESTMRRTGTTPPESVQAQQLHHARLMEQQRQHQAMSPHAQQQMQMQRQQQQQMAAQNGRARQVFGGPGQQQQMPQQQQNVNGQSTAVGGPEIAFSPQAAGTPQLQQQAYHQMQQAQQQQQQQQQSQLANGGSLPLFRPPPNQPQPLNATAPQHQQQGYPPSEHNQYLPSLGAADEGSSPANMVAPSPRPGSVTQNHPPPPPLAEIQEAISRHPSYANNNMNGRQASQNEGSGKMQPPTVRTTRRTTISNNNQNNAAATPAGSQGAPTPTPNGLAASNGNQGSPDAVHSQPPTPRTPNTQTQSLANGNAQGQQESGGGQSGNAAKPSPATTTKGKKRTAVEANAASAPKETKKARPTRASAAAAANHQSTDVAVPSSATEEFTNVGPQGQSAISRQATPQQQHRSASMSNSNSQANHQQQQHPPPLPPQMQQQQQGAPNGYHYQPQAQQHHMGNIAVPTLPIQMLQMQHHQQQQPVDIIVGPGSEYGDLSAFGLSNVEGGEGMTHMNQGDPNSWMLEDPSNLNFEEFLNWG